MSDSVDRVFVHALATVRRLPRTGSSRPPTSSRLQLYGLYKQSMEGDVSAILPRPSLPRPGPETGNTDSPSNRYTSRDLRIRDAKEEIEKWDAWHACAGMSRTEAKRRYITTLIATMKEYASGTAESRELVSELEFVWNQIRSQSGSDESEEGESPTRRLERSGLKSVVNRPGASHNNSSSSGGNNARGKQQQQQKTSRSHSQTQGLRVLSPISQHGSDGIIENEELLPLQEPVPMDDGEEEEEEEEEDDDYASASEDKLLDDNTHTRQPRTTSTPAPGDTSSNSQEQWRHQVESHLRHLATELAALREQLSSSHMLSRSSFSIPMHLPLWKRVLYRISTWARWLFWTSIRQACIQLCLLLAVLIWGRIRGDRRAENWCRQRLNELSSWSRQIAAKTRDSDLSRVTDKLRVI